MHDEGPSEGQERDFILIQDDDTDLGSQSSKLKDEIIKEKEAEIQSLSLDLERAKWVINYLEQQNKQLEDKQTIGKEKENQANFTRARNRGRTRIMVGKS